MAQNITTIGTFLFLTTLLLPRVISQTCNSAGVYCADASTFQICPEGSATNVPIGNLETCPSGMTCDKGCNSECTPATELPCPACNEQHFFCPSTTSFQQCTGTDLVPDPQVEECQNGNHCDIYCKYECLQVATCLTCTEPRKYPSQGHRDRYLLCIPGQPVVEYTCTSGSLFDDALQRCVKPSVTATTTAGTTTMTTTTTALTTTTTATSATATSPTTPTTTPALIVVSCDSCHAANCVYADPNKCTQYLVCILDAGTGKYTQNQYTCSNHRYYDAVGNKCSTDSAVCLGVRPLFAVARQLPVDVPFECTEVGKFEHPNCCKDYYWCAEVDHLLDAFSYSCPGRSVFNPDTKRCSFWVPEDCVEQGC